MRVNLPITNAEYELSDGVSLVSRTDLKGRILYANLAFIEASGFSEAELLGKPHNLVRHPDMPEEAFADLWATVKAGLPWSGVVKNRRKNGDFYWVFANVTPVHENGMANGYLSVRTRLARPQIVEAEHLYRQFKEGRADHMAIRHGMVVRTGLIGRLMSFRRTPVNLRIALSTGIGAALMLGVGLFGGWETSALAKAAGVQSALPAFMVTAGGIGALLTLLFGYFISRTILRPLDRALGVAHAIAGGDLSLQFEVSAWDETGQLMRALTQMKANMVGAVSDIGLNVESIRIAASEIASGNADLSGRTESQASSLEETASSMEELTSTVKQNAEHARHANQLVGSTAEIAARGGAVVGQVVDTMASISASSKKIADIIGVIDGIAFQTNILALNAAVEAARAGEQGRGRRRRGRSQEPGTAFRRGRPGDQVAYRRFGGKSRSGQQTGGRSGRGYGRYRHLGGVGGRTHERDCHGKPAAERRHRTGQSGNRADGRNDPAECCAGGAGSSCRREPA